MLAFSCQHALADVPPERGLQKLVRRHQRCGYEVYEEKLSEITASEICYPACVMSWPASCGWGFACLRHHGGKATNFGVNARRYHPLGVKHMGTSCWAPAMGRAVLLTRGSYIV